MSTLERPPSDGEVSLAGQIKGSMARRHLTMRSLSELTDIPYGTLQGYLLGRHPIPAYALGRIAKVLDVSADWLIFERPATFDRHCLALALAKLDEIKSAGEKAGHEMSLLSLAQLFSDFYSNEYLDHHVGQLAQATDTTNAEQPARNE